MYYIYIQLDMFGFLLAVHTTNVPRHSRGHKIVSCSHEWDGKQQLAVRMNGRAYNSCSNECEGIQQFSCSNKWEGMLEGIQRLFE